MSTNVVYCNTCSPKVVLGAGAIALPARHWLEDGTEHNDCSIAEINITRNAGESADDFHTRIEANHQADMI